MEWVVAGGAGLILLVVVVTVMGSRRRARQESADRETVAENVKRGAEPVSLHPRIDLDRCLGTGACVEVCPELDVLAVVDGKAVIKKPTACIGHGECLRACPVDAITLVIGSAKRGIDIPHVGDDYESNVPGLYIVGELGGMGLIYNAMNQAMQCMTAVAKKPPKSLDGGFQVAIIGAGPAGLAASLGAKAAGLSYVTLDQDSPGGTILNYPRNKIVMTRPIKLPLGGTLKVSSIKKEDLLAEWNRIIASAKLEIRSGTRVESVRAAPDDQFVIAMSGGEIRARRVVLAVGRRGTPRKLGVPGEESSKVAYKLLEPENYQGKRCLVVGGGDAAIEAAVALSEAGCEVDLSYRKDVFSRLKPRNQERLDQSVEAERVRLWLTSTVQRIEADAVELKQGDEAHSLPNDYVFVFAGGVLPTQFLKNAGVDISTFRGEAFAPANQ